MILEVSLYKQDPWAIMQKRVELWSVQVLWVFGFLFKDKPNRRAATLSLTTAVPHFAAAWPFTELLLHSRLLLACLMQTTPHNPPHRHPPQIFLPWPMLLSSTATSQLNRLPPKSNRLQLVLHIRCCHGTTPQPPLPAQAAAHDLDSIAESRAE